MALISRAEDVVGIAVLNFRGEVTFPAGFAKGMLAGHLHWLFPIRNGEEADLTLHKTNINWYVYLFDIVIECHFELEIFQRTS